MLGELTCPEKKQNIQKAPDFNHTLHCMHESSLHEIRGSALCSESEIHPVYSTTSPHCIPPEKSCKTIWYGYLQIRRNHRMCFSFFSVKVGSFSNSICPSVNGQNSTLPLSKFSITLKSTQEIHELKIIFRYLSHG